MVYNSEQYVAIILLNVKVAFMFLAQPHLAGYVLNMAACIYKRILLKMSLGQSQHKWLDL